MVQGQRYSICALHCVPGFQISPDCTVQPAIFELQDILRELSALNDPKVNQLKKVNWNPTCVL